MLNCEINKVGKSASSLSCKLIKITTKESNDNKVSFFRYISGAGFEPARRMNSQAVLTPKQNYFPI